VLKEGDPVLAISVAGGDLQDQVTLGLLLDFIEFGLDPAAAVTAPRFATYHHQDSFDPNPVREQTFIKAGSLTLDGKVDKSVSEALAERGHEIQTVGGPIGHPVMLYRDTESGLFHAAGDPAANRHAAGLEDD
jgi:gamma-glutamyltranspeptidase / glutathione hydrolase